MAPTLDIMSILCIVKVRIILLFSIISNQQINNLVMSIANNDTIKVTKLSTDSVMLSNCNNHEHENQS